MKKIISIIFAATILMACGSYRTLDLGTLTFGMTTQDVVRIAGKPQRILSVRDTPDGHQEVLEYETSSGEVYALEFWDNYLTGYEYLYDDYTYIVPAAPPLYYPEYGRPIYIYPDRPYYNPERPARPTQPARPNRPNRPTQPAHPNRPTQPARPNRPETSRPGQTNTPSRNELTRPTESTPRQPSRSGGRELQ